jgi:hypothetical protein
MSCARFKCGYVTDFRRYFCLSAPGELSYNIVGLEKRAKPMFRFFVMALRSVPLAANPPLFLFRSNLYRLNKLTSQ